MKTYRPDLKPCPFCGGVPYEETCDALITIGCDVCNYHIYGNGLLTTVMTSVKIPGNNSLYYNSKAYKEMDARWNRRYYPE